VGRPSTGPGSKNARRRKAAIVFFDESGISLTPIVRSTWAPKGHTPVICHHFNWKRVSMAAGLCYGSHGGGCRLALHVQPGSYNTETLIGVLGELHRFLGGEKATLLWDGLPAHRSRAMQAFVASQRRWLVVERLPAYAPELNPVEALWANLKGKGGELANFAGDTLDQVAVAATRGADRVRQTLHLPYWFLRRCGVSLW
jgi:DDE superfamily endonuclease